MVSTNGLSLSSHVFAAERRGFDAAIGRKLCAGEEAGLLPHLHAVLAERGGETVLESYGTGADENWGAPLGEINFGAETLHDLRSVSKSIVSLLYGIALERGDVPRLDTPILELFPGHEDLAADPKRRSLTVEHALTMTLGMEWDESRPYTDPENSEIAMERAADRYRFILERPFVAEPGARWIYSGGATALVGEILQRGTGRKLPDFAHQVLFEPLGIQRFEWSAGEDGTHSPASGLRLSGPDLLKIGRLVLDNGIWKDHRVVPEAWITASLRPVIATGEGPDYGYFWFCGQAPVPALGGPTPWYAGFGNGGQRLWLCPTADIAAVIFSGNYNNWNAWIPPTRVWSEIILANLREA
ncbi:serine hydrolase domain-containing protein [Roseibium marinum]|uniref:CubicO group peptidase (Beta-lactamase class C family) n=1 Tax=Roseibium marinum TaxID=281252 RepID=A0A2S3UM95_9HYPH|nr:serine hydrolase [Roseibium marinum]POF28690.1 CubicO group peptidase (beta-lactamase class C family) [Roseibium marinum]